MRLIDIILFLFLFWKNRPADSKAYFSNQLQVIVYEIVNENLNKTLTKR